MRSALPLRLLAATTLLAFGRAGAVPPTTITANGLNTTVMAPTGGVYNITGGTTVGSNLFHSFSTFNLGTGDTADFNVTSGISNILARVTGGPSTIDGKITSTNVTTGMLSSANLFFINPSGVMFTSNAQVNLGGSLIVSTANYVKLSDGKIFYGDINHPMEDAGLTTAPVSAFGFISGSGPMPLSISDGATFTVGGSLEFVGGTFTAGSNTLSVSGASSSLGIFSLSLVSTMGDAIVPSLTSGAANYSTATNVSNYGTVTLGNTIGAKLSATGSSGAVVIRGGKLMQMGTGGSISTTTGPIGIDTSGDITMASGTITSQGGSITLGQTSLVNLTLDSASSITETAGSSGTLSINSTGTINNSGTISTSGTASPLQLTALALNLTSGTITTSGSALALGTVANPLGGLSLDSHSTVSETGASAATLAINSSGTISNSGTISTQSGAITIDTTGDMMLSGGTISTQSDAITIGQTSLGNLSLDSSSMIESLNGGPVTVVARGDINLNGGSIASTSSTATDASSVRVTDAAGNITLSNGAEIASISSGSGNAGNVTINGGVLTENSTKTLTITGTGVATPNTGIFSMSTGTGGAGAVNVTAIGNVVLSAGGQIASVATNTSGGNAQAVTLTLNPNNLFETNFNTLTIGGISANATTAVPIIYSSTANAANTDGNVTINALSTSVELQPGAAIQTSSQDTVAGNVYVQAGSLLLDQYSAIQSVMSQVNPGDSAVTGKTGSVEVIVFNLDLADFDFFGPLSIAKNAYIQTQANPNVKMKGFNPVGQVTVYAGSLTEGGTVTNGVLMGGTSVTSTDGFDFDYKVKGAVEIRMENIPNLNGANGVDAGPGPLVETLLGYPSNPNSNLPMPSPGLGLVLDGTLGGTAGAIIPVYSDSTYTYTIDASDGTTTGNNLFLSFSQFDLGINHPDSSNPSKTGSVSEAADFNAPGVANILVRVTSNKASQINGTLEEAPGTNANLFFLNPYGVMFTTDASLNLNGALTVSTANAIALNGGGAFFSAKNTLADDTLTSTPSTSTLFAGPVTSFGFTGPAGVAPAPVTIETASLSNDSSANPQIQVVAGNITLEDDALLNASQTLLFSAGGPGTLTFAAGDSLATLSGSVTSSSQVLNDSSFAPMGSTTPLLGTVTLSGGSVITVPSPNFASTIFIRAGTFNLDDSLIVDQTTADAASLSGQVLIDVTGTASIASNTDSSFISTSTLGATNGGSIQINAASLSITGGTDNRFTTGILSTAQPTNFYTSDSGYIPYPYPVAVPANGNTTATGNAGAITLDIGGQINLSTFGQISTNTNGLGNAGTVTISALNGVNPELTVSGGSSITSSTSLDNTSFVRTGNAGQVRINASALTVTGNPSLIATSAGTAINPAGPTGNGGNINLNVIGQTGAGNGDISITSGGQISASSYNNGKGGTVIVQQNNSTDGISINGMGSTSSTGIFAAEFGAGDSSGINSFAIRLNTTSPLSLTAGGEISTSAAGDGSAGPIQIASGPLTIDGTGADSSQATGVLSSSTGTASTGSSSTGNGGNITLTVMGDLDVLNNGTISASSATVGDAGTVTISQSGSTDITDPAQNPATNGGIFLNGGSISTAANGTGSTHPANVNAGNITLNTQALTLTGAGSNITSSTSGLSKGGQITVNGIPSNQSTQFVWVEGGASIASNTAGAGDGGTITIKTGSLKVDGTGSAISTSATAGTGGGGNVSVTVVGNAGALGSTGDVVLTNGGMISASSDTVGEAGTVSITQSGSLDLTDQTLNPATNGGLFINGGSISTAADGTGTTHPANPSAGNIMLKTQGLTMTGTGSNITSSTSGMSKAGAVTISGVTSGQPTQFVVVENGAKISSETGTVNGSGAGGTITIGTGSLLVDNAAISTNATGGQGKAGDIVITASQAIPTQAPLITVQDGGTIMSESAGSGAAGMITLQANTIVITGLGSTVSTDAGVLGNVANSKGEIMLTGKDLNITNSGLVSATTGGLSPGGTITAKISDQVTLSLDGKMDASSTATAGGGNGGSVLIGSDPVTSPDDFGINSPNTLSLSYDSVISCDSLYTDGGSIAIHANQVIVENNSLLSTNEPNGDSTTVGGNITIRAGYSFYLNNNSYVDSNDGQGTGGNITIDPEFVVLDHSDISAAGGLMNGNVTIDSTYVFSGTSFITATGTIAIDSVPLDLTGSLAPLPANLTDEEKRLREKCARAINHEFSSLIVVGRGGTESGPEELQPDYGLPEATALNPAAKSTP